MEPVQREAVIQQLCVSGEYQRAVEETLKQYGAEMRARASSLVHQADLAEESFAMFREHLVKGLPKFRWESSLRTWLYRVVRNTCYQVLEASQKREELLGDREVEGEALRERSRTNPWLRTDVKEKFRALYQKLPAEDQILLQLRVTQHLEWVEIARQTVEPDAEEPSRADLHRRAATLRQRFQRMKEQLREMARHEGLLPEDTDGPRPPA